MIRIDVAEYDQNGKLIRSLPVYLNTKDLGSPGSSSLNKVLEWRAFVNDRLDGEICLVTAKHLEADMIEEDHVVISNHLRFVVQDSKKAIAKKIQSYLDDYHS
jgi:hypothetical protein